MGYLSNSVKVYVKDDWNWSDLRVSYIDHGEPEHGHVICRDNITSELKVGLHDPGHIVISTYRYLKEYIDTSSTIDIAIICFNRDMRKRSGICINSGYLREGKEDKEYLFRPTGITTMFNKRLRSDQEVRDFLNEVRYD